MIALSGTSKPEHMREDLAVPALDLDADELARIAAI
jgi:hypothetical protein